MKEKKQNYLIKVDDYIIELSDVIKRFSNNYLLFLNENEEIVLQAKRGAVKFCIHGDNVDYQRFNVDSSRYICFRGS